MIKKIIIITILIAPLIIMPALAFAAFSASILNDTNTFSSGTLLLSDSINATNCLTSPNLANGITTNVNTCSTYPLTPTGGQLLSLNNTGTLFPGSSTLSTTTTCGVQDFNDLTSNDLALTSGNITYLQPGPPNLANSYSAYFGGTNGYLETLSQIPAPGLKPFQLPRGLKLGHLAQL